MEAKLIDEAADTRSEDEGCEHAPLLTLIAEDADVRRHSFAGSANESLPISPDAKAEGLTRAEKRTLTIIIVSAAVFSLALTVGLIEQSITQAVEVLPHGGIVTSSAECTEIARDILRQGGSAVDAAVAAVLCIGVVRPDLSSIGGGGFMLLRQHRKKVSQSYDFREAAPGSTASRLINSSLQRKGPGSVAVPGMIAGLYRAHQDYGKLLWPNVVKPAATLARDGFKLSSSTVLSLSEACGKQTTCTLPPAYLLDGGGTILKPGSRVQRSAYADVLDLVAEGWPQKSFYQGPVANDILTEVSKFMNASDLMNYSVIVGTPVQASYNGYTLLSTGTPSAGVAVLHALCILDGYNWTTSADDTPQMMQRVIQALNFSDDVFSELSARNLNYTLANLSMLAVDKLRCQELRNKIKDSPSLTQTSADQVDLSAASLDSKVDFVSIVDSDELFVTVETSLGSSWGSGVVTKKYDIVLNNALAEFGAEPHAVRPWARPRSIASPIIFYTPSPSCRKRGTVGSIGGRSSIGVVVQTLVDLLSFGYAPSTTSRNSRVEKQLSATSDLQNLTQGLSATYVDYLRNLHTMDNRSSLDNAVSVIQKVDYDVSANSDGQNLLVY